MNSPKSVNRNKGIRVSSLQDIDVLMVVSYNFYRSGSLTRDELSGYLTFPVHENGVKYTVQAIKAVESLSKLWFTCTAAWPAHNTLLLLLLAGTNFSDFTTFKFFVPHFTPVKVILTSSNGVWY